MLKTLFRFPYLSLTLLLVTYAVFGWQWLDRAERWNEHLSFHYFLLIFWSALALITFLVTGLMTAPLGGLRSWLLKWFQSDTRSFIAAMGLTLVGVIFIVNLNITLDLMILITALMLARLELQDRKFNEWLTFWILLLVALGGMAFGSLLHYSLGRVSL
ncbi:MAG: hypothetical protein ACOYME_12400 [Prochlorotrichaceae cyanobacterium]|jgi:hypothetical protein